MIEKFENSRFWCKEGRGFTIHVLDNMKQVVGLN